MYIKNLLLGLVLLAGQTASANIMQTPFINVVHDHVKSQDTLMVFDLDQTVFEVPGTYVNDFWFANMLNHARALGYDDDGALRAVVPLYEKRMAEAPAVAPVEVDTIGVIRTLQEKGIPVVALTARGQNLASSTIQQLNSIGIDFSKTSITPYNISFSLKAPAVLRNGVMFCASNSKGEALKALLNATAYTPKKIVFVDDNEKHVQAVMKAVTDLNMEFVGIRYSHLDEKVKQFVLDDASKSLVAPPAQKIIVEHDSVEAIKDYLVDNTIVLFDVDDTLMYLDNETGFGGNKWINQMMVQGQGAYGCTREDLEAWVAPMYFDAQHKLPYKAVEETTATLIKDLQATGVPVMGLTARRLELIEITNKWLLNLGIDLSLTAPAREPMSFSINHPNVFVKGVLFCGGSQESGGKRVHAKDKAIKAFFKHLNLKPARVIVVDDQKHYLEPIVSAIVSLGIDCVGIRYSRSDERMSSFSLDDDSKALLAKFAQEKAQQK